MHASSRFSARRPAVIAAYMVFLLLPLLLGILGGSTLSHVRFARQSGGASSSQICGGLAEALIRPLTALEITLPSYLVLAIGLFVRTLVGGKPSVVHDHLTEHDAASREIE